MRGWKPQMQELNRLRRSKDIARRKEMTGNSLISVFRPKVDEISLLTINSSRSVSSFDPIRFRWIVDSSVSCDIRPHKVTEEQWNLRAFPFPLKDDVKDGLYILPTRSFFNHLGLDRKKSFSFPLALPEL
uniref:Uncharacterized protein n=1 Tax=Cucumis melo TaxID=3656 RepID=A0A9I9E8F4_CUCME